MKRGEGPMIRTALVDKGDPKAGKVVYERFCLTCHGPTGKGDGPTGRLLTPRPSGFSKRMPHHAERWANYYFKIIKEGGRAVGRSPMMAPWGPQLKDDEIWDVASYIQILANGS